MKPEAITGRYYRLDILGRGGEAPAAAVAGDSAVAGEDRRRSERQILVTAALVRSLEAAADHRRSRDDRHVRPIVGRIIAILRVDRSAPFDPDQPPEAVVAVGDRFAGFGGALLSQVAQVN